MVGVDVAPWLASLPLAPEFHPSEEEFVDPIAYILKIEQEASHYGICKIVPPYSRAPENTVLSNLNASLAATQDATTAAATAPGSCSIHAATPLARSMCSAVGGEGDARVVMPQSVDSTAKFTTRRQQLGWNPRRPRGGSQYRAQKQVWESGEYYTLEQFEDKAKAFSSTTLGPGCDDLSPLAVETLFWNAEFSKPISIEYANDIPGSAFLDSGAGAFQGEDGRELAGSGWNIRNIARSHGSLLKCMPDEVPGVTTPMVYLGMLFSWFAWHVEDHELHSLNYLHTGARKTWYAVPSDAACALEEVIRLYGYGSRLKPRAAFTLLGEKTTVLSPEVLVAAGVPCCRLVQNPGEYVITFPRAYHLGFSHGFNCGEAANFATPAWLEVAREAAARRASMSHLPMLSHEQLLYLFTMSLAKSPSSPQLQLSTFKVESAVKTAFVNEVKQNNTVIAKLLEFGVEGCVFLRECKTPGTRPQATAAETMIASQACETETQQTSHSDTGSLHAEKNNDKPFSVESKSFSPDRYGNANEASRIAPLPTPWGALPCAACGILCFASMALVQPTATPTFSYRQRKQPQKCRTSQAGVLPPSSLVDVSDIPKVDTGSIQKKLSHFSGICQLNSAHEEPDAGDCDMLPELSSLSDDNIPDSEALQKLLKVRTRLTRPSLELLAEMYKDDLKEDIEQCGPDVPPDAVISTDEVGTSVDAPWLVLRDEPCVADSDQELQNQAVVEAGAGRSLSAIFVSKGLWFGEEPTKDLDILDNASATATNVTECDSHRETEIPVVQAPVCSFNCESNNIFSTNELDEDCSAVEVDAANPILSCSNNEADVDKTIGAWKFYRGSARPYVLCLEHAVEAVTKLQPLGGATVLVICHPNYGSIQRKAEELGQGMHAIFNWQQIPLREASEAEVEIVNKAIHLKIDNSLGWNWCAKMGIGSRRNRKGTAGIVSSEVRLEQEDRKTEAEAESEIPLTTKPEAEKKMIWCGRQWKASQVHPLLGGGKSAAHLLSQVLRIQKRLQPAMKIRNSFPGLSSQPLKKLRKDGWEQQERVMTAAILRKSKRNAVAREGRKKRLKFDGLQARLQQAQHGVCKQAVFSLECNSSENQQNDQDSTKNHGGTNVQGWLLTTCETSFNPASSSTGCQRNSDFDSAELVKWHDVPVSCSPSLGPPMQAYEWSSDISPNGICSTSQQDTGFDEMQEWDQRPADRARKLVARLKRRSGDSQMLVLSKKARIECVENSDELNSLMEDIPDSVSGLIATDAYADESEEDGKDDEVVVDESASDIDEYFLRSGSASDTSPPKALPCFAASRKRSSSKSRVKRATWENLLNRLAAPAEEVALIQNQDSFPLSCVTETGWEGIECGTYRSKKSETPQGGKKRGGGGKRAKAAGAAAATTTAAAGNGGGGNVGVVAADEMDDANNPFPCDVEGCTMSFNSEQELAQHKKNKCTFKGCGKRFFSHKYLVQHRRVHMDERPLKCPWQGCTMSFKWAWARTEHIRVHTGERPYSCPECDKTFRFVSDFSRHKRNTGHARA
ncbi:hypothetical protein SELMODRAFT_440762 [Selaginella moellendorffii]|uniref:Lysine-specific demethylase REF6 n=1 Tax=Selaginella moellendorffii TaxID=88036 RepID=D8RE62_SELML|nr:lysine-specific demethylase JMJ705 [Selaginella moellendorffii]EFJ29606.1 hypothetical protein SELMODRAFT_440762 [Selaginella moellendorffii]|eukprot:XP_002969518.1 lysine-specific demethylase JMJ705 [Selaginella moellendorffii]